jgi:polyisoprenoid-binding protein YceI
MAPSPSSAEACSLIPIPAKHPVKCYRRFQRDQGNGSRDKRMHKEILESQKYPEAVFTPDQVRGQIEPEGTSEIDVHGNFRIHGADHEIIVHFQVQATAANTLRWHIS